MPTELKPCPFCGGDPVEFRYSGSPCVGCKDCIAYLGGEESDLTYAQLAEAWNLRADQQTVAQLQARVAELAAALADEREKSAFWAEKAHEMRGQALRGEPVDGIIQP